MTQDQFTQLMGRERGRGARIKGRVSDFVAMHWLLHLTAVPLSPLGVK